jgi:hypothetical protein
MVEVLTLILKIIKQNIIKDTKESTKKQLDIEIITRNVTAVKAINQMVTGKETRTTQTKATEEKVMEMENINFNLLVK